MYSTKIIAGTTGCYNPEGLSYAYSRDWPAPNTAYVHWYQGQSFKPKDFEAIKRHPVQRWRITAWSPWPWQIWVPEDFASEPLQYALSHAERVAVHICDRKPASGPGPLYDFEEQWDRRRLDDDDSAPPLPKCTVALAFPLVALNLWCPILKRWTRPKPDCVVGLMDRDEDGGFNILDDVWGV